ncbi:MAG: chromosome segregation protein SMC [Clostridiales bacterium]|nr:chromosome segregation protein SMC [Candidatus Scatonaster coprocaballi]
MHLKKLEIQGFKSFPEYTLIEFDKGMTAIVGPNGSGKSNVTDAIRWVLGEQSVKTLRGSKMEDVIFNGTQAKRAMNFAEVSMTLDNSDGILPVEYYEVQVTRRLYRSGESEYQINHVNCRMKDIQQLFMDTGLGKDGYSIIGQGRVDDILSTKSEDRRKVLEEASGIVKFKSRKDEAERKLASSEQNLVRINDILEELNHQIGPLADQAEKAKRYHVLYDEWKKDDIAVILHMIDRNKVFLDASADERQSLANAIKSQEDLVLQIRAENRELTERSASLEEELENTRQERSDLTEKIHEINNQMVLLKERHDQLKLKIQAAEGSDEERVAEVSRLSTEIEHNQSQLENWSQEKANLSNELSAVETSYQALMDKLADSQAKQSELRKKIDILTNEIFEAREAVSSLSGDLMVKEARIKSLSEDRMLMISERDEAKKKRDQADEDLKAGLKFAAEQASALSEKQEMVAQERQKAKTFDAELETKQRLLDRVEFSIKTLEDLEKSREGYQESVRRLLNSTDSRPELSKLVIGVLGELVQVEKEYETAIEIALGNAMHNVVTQNDRDASRLIDHLKENHLGRVTFLPIDSIRPRLLEDNLLRDAKRSVGYIGLASELIKTRPELHDIIENLLGRIVVVDTLDHGIAMAKASRYVYRVVSLAGDVVNPGGSLTGGSINKKSSNLLSRSRELEDFREKKKLLIREISKMEAQRQDFDLRIKELAREELEMEEKLQNASLDRIRVESVFTTADEDYKKTLERITSVEQELERISAAKLTSSSDLEESKQVIAEREDEVAEMKEKLNSSSEKDEQEQSDLERMRAQISDLRVRVESVNGSIAQTQERIRMFENEKQKNLDDQERLKQESAQARLDAEAIKKDFETQANFKEGLKLEDEKFEQKIRAIVLEKEELEGKLTGFIDKVTAASSKLSQLQSEQTRLESKLERYEIEVDECKNRLWENHELTYDNAQEYRMEIENLNAMNKRLSELRAQIKEIGSVNVDAVEEYQQISERYEFMCTQRDDIEKAKADLMKVIDDLISEMKQQFLTHFAQINENFKTVFADLFNGGTAEILLENEEDVLNCGIDIKAQPPGKKLQSLSLLSGGERCLTAIALLFAILQLRPSPFCVLDEVEAALDDANVNRFTDFVRRYCARSQFIMVTHRKGTMEACDRMYGVTMQERGISKILSMRLSEV